MRITVGRPIELGSLIRAKRKMHKMRQDDAAGAIGVSDVFLMRLENGAPGARLDKVLLVLKEMGITLYADVPDEVGRAYADLLNKKDE